MVHAASRNLHPWIGSVALHVLVAVALAVAAMRWRTDPPPPQLAIEGSVVRYEDLPSSVKAGKSMREPQPATVPQAAPRPVPKPKVEPVPTPAAELRHEQEAREQQARVEAKAADAARRRAEQKQQDAAAQAAKSRAEAEQKEKLETARKQQAEQDAVARAAKLKAAHEAELRRALADEEEGEAVARSGVTDEYSALLRQTIERNWNRPSSARAGLECTLFVTQATGGTVLDVKFGDCNGDQAIRESVANAVYRSSPLPPPRDPRAFERRLVIVFKPTE